jgi:alpha-beta hydrolase superfamily lysophospholipase
MTQVCPAPTAVSAYPPPAGPRLHPDPGVDPGSRPYADGATHDARVDWSQWQARIRAVARPIGVPAGHRIGIGPRARAVVLLVLASVVFGTVAVRGVRSGGRATAVIGPGVAAAAVAGARPDEQAAPGRTAEGARPAGAGAYPVAKVTLDLVDRTRAAVWRGVDPSGGDGTETGRQVMTVVRYPDVAAGGPFPLVVFAHGYGTRTEAYAALLDELASAGYVVASPESALASTGLAVPLGARDPEAQALDVAFVVSALLSGEHGATGLRGAIRPAPVAVVGHSDGGTAVAAVAFANGVRDPRVGAAVVLSGAYGGFGGSWFAAGSPPLLAIHGDADAVNPPASSAALYVADRSGSPRFLVYVEGGGHEDAFLSERTRPALLVLIDDFVRAALGTDPSAADRLASDASVPGVLYAAQ